MGNEVNIAARLMTKARPGEILVTPHVRAGVGDRFEFQRREKVELKGLSQPLTIHAVTSRGGRPTLKILLEKVTAPIHGRLEERNKLASHLSRLSGRQSSAVIIQGEAGIGKSRLAEDLLEQAQPLPIRILRGGGDAIEQSVQYHAWRPIFAELFGIDMLVNPTPDDVGRIEDRLSDAPELLSLLPLANQALRISLPDTDATRQLHGTGRANRTNDLLCSMLKHLAGDRPLLLRMEDVHWMDSHSWSLTRLVAYDIKPLLLVMVTRPMSEPLMPVYSQLLKTAEVINLTNLRPEEVSRLV